MLEAMKRIAQLAIFSCSGEELVHLELAYVFDFAYGETDARPIACTGRICLHGPLPRRLHPPGTTYVLKILSKQAEPPQIGRIPFRQVLPSGTSFKIHKMPSRTSRGALHGRPLLSFLTVSLGNMGLIKGHWFSVSFITHDSIKPTS